ncbi:MAG TPA: class I SAM-dependent methyltransferase [Thermoplasmatales archaeon]|nr:class I SAM-dependent methyltransferase [Thermoplasmatales archaeon]
MGIIERFFRKLVGLSFIIWEYTSTYIPSMARIVIDNYSLPIIKKEVSAVRISRDDRFIQIGCGSIPYTALIIAELTGASVTGIDIDPVAVKNAQIYVKNNKRTPIRINIEEGDGAEYNLSNFDVIMISLGVNNIEGVFANITKSAKKDARIIFRNLSRFDPHKIIPDEYIVKKRLIHPMFWESVILERVR